MVVREVGFQELKRLLVPLLLYQIQRLENVDLYAEDVDRHEVGVLLVYYVLPVEGRNISGISVVGLLIGGTSLNILAEEPLCLLPRLAAVIDRIAEYLLLLN